MGTSPFHACVDRETRSLVGDRSLIDSTYVRVRRAWRGRDAEGGRVALVWPLRDGAF